MHFYVLDEFVVVICKALVKLWNHYDVGMFAFVGDFRVDNLIVLELFHDYVVLIHVRPNLLNVVDHYFGVLIALLHNHSHDLSDLVIKNILLIFTDELHEKLSLCIRKCRYMSHSYAFEFVLVVIELINIGLVDFFPLLIGAYEFNVVKCPGFEGLTGNS